LAPECIPSPWKRATFLSVFWGLMPRTLVEVYRRFGRKFCFHIPSKQKFFVCSVA
jgi:hypothetical protein